MIGRRALQLHRVLEDDDPFLRPLVGDLAQQRVVEPRQVERQRRRARGIAQKQATPAGLPPHVAIRLPAALDRTHRAEAAFADRLTAAERPKPLPEPGNRSETLLARVRVEDTTPETLARLRREIAFHREFPPPLPEHPAQPPPDLLSASKTYRTARAALIRAARGLAFPDRPILGDSRDFDRLGAAIAAYQRSAAGLSRQAARSAGQPQLLPLDAFLRHPELRAAPHRAAAAWAAHATARGVRLADLPARLTRTLATLTALPRMFSPAFLLTASATAGRWLGRIAAAVVEMGPDR